MKVYIGPYLDWIGPYQIAEKIIFWADRYDDDDPWADRQHRLGRWLAEDRHGNDSWLTKLCQWIHSKQQRKIAIRIDHYDVWGMDHTLALIVHPMLIKLKEQKHGSPSVDDEDVPEALRSTSAPAKANEWDTDDNHHARWDWVLDEMIFAFSQHVLDDWRDQFHSGEHDIWHQKVDYSGNKIGEPIKGIRANVSDEDDKSKFLWQMVKGPNDTHVFDAEGAKAWGERIANGRRLFAKYYEALWD